mmetsp:Transcript_10736/g.28721  ORF Transcript_10736/g.28721 Transcript_10736/m.28721 type:complete len:685 (+) Transcript_10736:131-2185(+)
MSFLNALPLEAQARVVADDALFALIGAGDWHLGSGDPYARQDQTPLCSNLRADESNRFVALMQKELVPIGEEFRAARAAVSDTLCQRRDETRIAAATAIDELLDEYVEFVAALQTRVRQSEALGVHAVVASVSVSTRVALAELRALACTLAAHDLSQFALLDALSQRTRALCTADNVARSASMSKRSSAQTQTDVLGTSVAFVLRRSAAPLLLRVNHLLRTGLLLPSNADDDFFVVRAPALGPQGSTLSHFEHETFGADRLTLVRQVNNEVATIETLRGELARKLFVGAQHARFLHALSRNRASTECYDDFEEVELVNVDELIGLSERARFELRRKILQWEQRGSLRVMAVLRGPTVRLVDAMRELRRVLLVESLVDMYAFLNAAGTELDKPAQAADVTAIQRALGDTILRRKSKNDSRRVHVRCYMSRFTIDEQLARITAEAAMVEDEVNVAPRSELSGYDCIALELEPSWPMSVVFCATTLAKLQLVFRVLLQLVRGERALTNAWRAANFARKQSTCQRKILNVEESVVRWHRVAVLRHRMLLFAQSTLQYMLVEVIAGQWHVTLDAVGRATATVEAAAAAINAFADGVAKDCALSNRRVTKLLAELSRLCVLLAAMHARAFAPTLAAVMRMERAFDGTMRRLLDALGASARLSADPLVPRLCAQLDYNEYYTLRATERAPA